MTEIKIAVKEFADQTPAGASVLDVGCGLRPYEVLFPHAKYVGVDVPQSGRESDGKRPDFEFDGIFLPFDGASFDGIICTEVLEHATNPDALLGEMYRVLRPSGRLLITAPFIWGLHELPYDFRRYTHVGIRTAVELAGFTITAQSKLTEGTAAIQMLISSETNFYLKNVASSPPPLLTSYLLPLQARLLQLVFFIWKHCLRFERVYIDNMIVAQKPSAFSQVGGELSRNQMAIKDRAMPLVPLTAAQKQTRFEEKMTAGQNQRLRLTKAKTIVKGLLGK